jgi:hypothetical protein
MAKCKIIRRIDCGKNHQHEAGTVADVPDEFVDELVAAGAVEVVEKKPVDGKKT